MLTPKFEVSQDERRVTVTIFATYARVSDAEVNIQDNTFTFYSSPYYLRLTFSGKLQDSELERYSAKFDADLGGFVVACEKQVAGEHFTNLDMLTTLLAPPGATAINKPLIEVLDGGDVYEEDDEDIDWFYEQKLPEETLVTGGHKYGFGNKDTGVFSALQSELKGVIDLSDPDNKSASQRRAERLAFEQSVFDEDHYLADYFEEDTVREYLEFSPQYYTLSRDEVALTEEDKNDLLQLPRKELLLEGGVRACVYLGLVDIMYAWCYNHRVTLGDNCVESAWNVSKISATLSWLETFSSLRDVVHSCLRRALTFPLIRNWDLSQQVLLDTITILSLGKKQVLHCLLDIQKMFNESEPRYLLNQLYVTDYCVWVQTVADNKLTSVADSLKKVSLSKRDLGLELDELEAAGRLVLEEQQHAGQDTVGQLAANMAAMTVIENGAALTANDNEAAQEGHAGNNRAAISHAISDDSDSSSDSDSDSDSDDSDSSDSSDEESSDDDSEKESSSDSSSLDSDDDTLSGNESS